MYTSQAGGYGKVITHVIIGLKSVKGTKQLKLDPTIYDSLQKEKVLPGDVIYIEANSGANTLCFSQYFMHLYVAIVAAALQHNVARGCCKEVCRAHLQFPNGVHSLVLISVAF